MRSETTRRRLLAGGAGSVMALLSGCASTTPFVGQRVTDAFSVSTEDVDRLSVLGTVGSIAITGEDRDDIEVDVVKQSSSVRTDLDDLTVERSVRDGLLELRSEYDGETGWFEAEPRVDLTIALPTSVSVETVDSTVGETTIRNVAGDMSVGTTTGSVTVENVDGSVDAESTTGRIELSNVSGVVTAEATTGRVVVRDVGTTGDVTTTTGRIDVEIPAIEGDTLIEATTGRIEAAVGTDIDAEIRARSNTGSVSADELPLTDVTRGSDVVGGRLGDGGPTIEFESTTGRITLEPFD